MTLDSTDDMMVKPHGGFAFKHGLILGAVGIVISLIIFFTGNLTSNWAQWVSMPVTIILLVMFMKKFRDQEQGGYMSFGKAFGLCFLMNIVSGVMGLILFFLYFQMDDTLEDQFLKKTYDSYIDSGMSVSQADQAIEMAAPFMTPSMIIVWGAVGMLIVAVIISLILAAIMKRKHTLA